MKKILIGLGAIIILAIGANFLWPSINGTKDLPMISYTETFNQDPSEYYVYFWQESCSYCVEFEPYLVDAANDGVPIYVVNMPDNVEAWYDWDGHHEIHDQVIGQIVNDVEVFDEEIDLADYPEEDGWRVRTHPDDESTLIARLEKALNNQEPQSAEALEIAGTPTLVRIVNGRLVGYSEGVALGDELLQQYSQ